ncbi:MAG: carboxylating nicotinate-nucleotide diphosphorylase [Pirellulaceae bacterium]|jgi:nicotinate-nucleotide pyrophosphorylase (carboxylating)|nr:carboxylating nicotinate-nucleotide diphosphorylase [Pirellulaceae bacterium]
MVKADFDRVVWKDETIDDCRHLIRLAVREDLGRGIDLTTQALVSESARGSAHIVARGEGVIAGLMAARLAIEEMQVDITWQPFVHDGDAVAAGTRAARLYGSTRDLLTIERILLNLIGRLSGVATLTRKYVDAIVGTSAQIYDTRKTTPGWRRLEKYAVGCGGGHNHRTGLFDAILIKDNHLAHANLKPDAAVSQAREFLSRHTDESKPDAYPVEIEVDTLVQFEIALGADPDIILLDNMTNDELAEAVHLRNAGHFPVVLEASGGVQLATVGEIAKTGVDRISVGAITHAAVGQDMALDWEQA